MGDNGLKEALRGLIDSKGKPLTESAVMATYRTWALIKQVGYDNAKASMPSATWYRHTRYLRAAGLSQADLCSAQVLPFRKRAMLLRPVQSWEAIRHAA